MNNLTPEDRDFLSRGEEKWLDPDFEPYRRKRKPEKDPDEFDNWREEEKKWKRNQTKEE